MSVDRLRFIREIKAAVQHSVTVAHGDRGLLAGGSPSVRRGCIDTARQAAKPGWATTPAFCRDPTIRPMGLFVDLIDLGERSTNDALEVMCKATHDHDADIWQPHDSPLISRLIELFTQRGLDRLDAFRTELLAWSTGARFAPAVERMARPIGTMERWTTGELSLVKLYLQHLPAVEWTLDDHMMAVDMLVQHYLPSDDLRSEAEWLSTRASLMGRVQANMEHVTTDQADTLLAAMPSTVAEAIAAYGGTRTQQATMDYARVRCAENVRDLADNARHRMRTVIADHVQERELGVAVVGGSSLETKLLDNFGTLNRDWRRIAVTEAGEAQTAGYVASLPVGVKVKRIEQYRNACAFCRSIDGRIMEVVDPAAPEKNGETQIWVGKSNVGRSASPRKRVGAVFKEREQEEMWWVPVGLSHPHCRGRWLPTIQDRPGDDPIFGNWLRALLTPAETKTEI